MGIKHTALRNLIAYGKARNLSETDTGAIAGATSAQWSNWKKRGEVSGDGIVYLAEHFPELLSENYADGSSAATDAHDPHEYVAKVRGVRAAAGTGEISYEHEEVDGSHAFKRSWLREKGISSVDRCKMIEVTGESMFPYLRDGDIVLVSLDDRGIKSGEVYVIVTDEGARVKRLFRRTNGAIEIRSDNESPEFPTETIHGEDLNSLRILGRVVWRGG